MFYYRYTLRINNMISTLSLHNLKHIIFLVYFPCVWFCFNITGTLENCIETKLNSSTCVVVDKLPLHKDGTLNYRAMPSIGNGYVGTVVMSDEIHISGVFNGRANVEPDSNVEVPFGKRRRTVNGHYNHTHRARIPSTVSVNFTTSFPDENRLYILDMEKGVFVQIANSSSFVIQETSYAHRLYKHILITELTIDTKVPLNILLPVLEPVTSDFVIISRFHEDGFQCYKAEIKETETATSEKVRIGSCYTSIPRWLNYTEAGKFTASFITVLTSSLDSEDPLQSAINSYHFAEENKQFLFQSHTEAWEQIWQTGNITVENNLYLGQSIYSSFYSILSSLRDDWEHGLSPGSLSMGYEYLGHTFWDQDTWMFPPILLFHPYYGKSLLYYRYQRLEAAEMIAKSYGFKGSMFPWESALSGFEVCPQQVYGRNEIHITGDIAFAVNQYFQATNDIDWMEQYGFDILYQSALFWESRVTYDKETGFYHINDVMPPDEYHYPVNNSVYTNIIAQNNFRFAIEFAEKLGKEVPESWVQILDTIYIPFDSSLQYHPEYDGFDIRNPKSVVKQADTILINFPLQYPMNETVKKNDLKYYGNITDPNGPAMTHSMFSIGWNEIGSLQNAHLAFEKNYENIQAPFFVWSELVNGEGAANFITAAGGYLQALIFGYGGLRLSNNKLSYNMHNLRNNESYCLNGIKYLGNILQFCRRTNDCVVQIIGHLDTYIDVAIHSLNSCEGDIVIVV